MAAEILNEMEEEIENLTLIPSDGGRFEVMVNNDLLFSKIKLNRFPQAGEVLRTVRKFLSEGKKS